MKKITLSLVAIAVLSVSSAASAGAFVGGGTQVYRLSTPAGDAETYGVYAQGGYDFGMIAVDGKLSATSGDKYETTLNDSVISSKTITASEASVGVSHRFDMGKFSLTPRVALVAMTVDGIDKEDTDTGYAYGLNAGYNFNENWGMNLGYTKIADVKINGNDVKPDSFNLGVQYNF